MLADMHNQKIMQQYSSLKAIQIIRAFSFSKDYLTITDICERTGLSPSTVHRILQELVLTDFVMKDGDKRYYIGPETIRLATRVNNTDHLLELSLGEMKRLNNLSRETIHLIKPDAYKGIYIGKLEAQNQIGLHSKVGNRIPLYCTAGGKTILAFQEEEWISKYIENTTFIQFTEKTILRQDELLEELKKIRVQGYSIDNREHNPDIICIAAPVLSSNGRVLMTIGISAPDYRFPLEKALSYAEEVVESAKTLEKLL